ncbi:MAG: 30S ribosomal protein S3ae, partial [Candidatus Methanofastidiosia archaeon]
KVRNKNWYPILAPKMFGNQIIGETPSNDPKKVVGRTIETSLRDLTGDFKKGHIKLNFKVSKVEGNKASTEFISHEISRSYMRSQIRRRNTKIEGIVDVKTKDDKSLRVIVAGIAFKRATDIQERSVRKKICETIENAAKNLTLEQFIQELVLSKVASDAFNKAKKIFPLRRVEVVKAKVLA